MRLQYVMRRFLLLFLVVWVAATLNFFLPAWEVAILFARNSCSKRVPGGMSIPA